MRGQEMADKTGDTLPTTKVRTTMRPDEDLEVTEVQRAELDAQGLLVTKTTKEN